MFLVVTGKFIENYIIRISESKWNFNEKNNYVSKFDEKHVLLWYETIRRKIFIECLSFYFLAFYICRKCDAPNVNFCLPTKKRFYRNLHYPIQERLSLLISKRVSHNFAEKLLAMLICLYINLPVHGHIKKFTKEAVLMPPWLVKKSKNK